MGININNYIPLSLNYNHHQSPYHAMIGTGGIGSGMFFALKGNHTLGREESRGGWFLDRHDYCKLHIISHYVQVLLGPAFHTILLGKVGDDDIGRRLMGEMRDTGLDIRKVAPAPGVQTLFSLCFTYPDGAGGNLTAEDSASAQVDAALIASAEPDFVHYQGHGVALAAPEVPLPARKMLLDLATRYRFLRVGAFNSAEIAEARQMGMFDLLDIIALNIHEAAALTGLHAEKAQPEEIVRQAVAGLSTDHPALKISLTAGKIGGWTWDGADLHFVPSFPANVVSTAGAGDAHLAGIIAGIVAGLCFHQAQDLGSLTAALSVTSPHTIAPEVCRETLRDFAYQIDRPVHPEVMRLLGI